MLRTKTSYLKYVKGLDQWDQITIRKIFYEGYDNNRGFGFLNTEIDWPNIYSDLLYQSLVSQRVFIPGENRLEAQPLVLFFSVPFSLNCGTGVFECYAGGDKLRKTLSVLSAVFDYKISIKDIYIDLPKFYKVVQQKAFPLNLTGLTVNNFRYSSGLVGRFDANVYDQKSAEDLLLSQDCDVVNLDIEVIFDDIPATWKISTVGGISIRTEEDELLRNSILLTDLIMECTNA